MHGLGRILIFGSFLHLGSFHVFAQRTVNQETHTYKIHKSSESITADGELNEDIWSTADKVGEFWHSFPSDDRAVETEYQTEVMMTYDDKNIYIAAICHGSGKLVIPSLKRDNDQFFSGDVFGVVFDAVNERTNGAVFSTNPAGVQHDMQVGANTGIRASLLRSSGFNRAWDSKWVVNSKRYPDKWVTEMAIPFKSLKYGNSTTWGINFTRAQSSTNSWHAWAPVPSQLVTADLGFTGLLIWDQEPPRAKGNISIIPYVLGSAFKDFEEGKKLDKAVEMGGDAKFAISSNLSLDLTLNPDFSQVDVDEQVTNLTTVNIRFPEKRLFFLENTDIFREFGIPPMRPFFSRKIGLDEDANPIPIQFGARLSGNLTNDLRIGLMNLQTNSTDEFLGQNYSSFTFNQRVFGRTLIKGYFNNRQAYENKEFSTIDYNRTLGGEIDYRSRDGTLRANTGYGGSLSSGVTDRNRTHHAYVSYNNRNITLYTNYMSVGDNYIPDMGFMTKLYHYDATTEERNRIGYTHHFINIAYTRYPENKKINNYRFEMRTNIDYTTSNQDLFNVQTTGSYLINLANTSSFLLLVSRDYAELFFPFDFTDFEPLPVGEYDWYGFTATYISDLRKTFFVTTGVEVGAFYNGERQQFALDLNYRKQPWGNFAIRFVQNYLSFPQPYGTEQLTLVGPKMEINMSRNLYWTTFLQYNTQKDNFNVNSRFQWQFKPLSNLFIVYTDNYAIEQWGPKNRGIVVKLNYWLSL